MRGIGIIISLVLTLILATIQLSAQSGKEKSPIKIGVTYKRVNEYAPVLITTAKIKSGKKFEPLEGASIKFFFTEETPEGFIGQVRTNASGAASFTLPEVWAHRLDSVPSFKFVASVDSTDRFDALSAEIEIARARIELTFREIDSVKNVTAKVLALKDGQWIVLPKTEVKLFVKRLYADLPFGESSYTTNEAGEVAGEFKINIPGDAIGNIIVGAKIDDSDEYGTVVSADVVKWGIPLKTDRSFYERSLWAARDKTPVWLLVVPNLIIATVWAIILYLLFLLRRIRKIGITN